MIRPVTRDEQYLTILERSTSLFTTAIESVARATLTGKGRDNAISVLANVIGRNLALSEILGRESTARVARYARKMFRDKPVTIIPNVPFTEALDDIRTRTPEVTKYATPEYVAEIIQRNGFTLAKSAELKVIEAVQRTVARLLEEGKPADKAGQVIAEMGDWSQAYGETVYRTNVSSAFAEGRIEQALDPDIAKAIPAFMYTAIDDGAARPNHLALDGFVAPTVHSAWQRIKPPNGFRCRCALDFIDVFEYERMQKRTGYLQRDGAHYPPSFYSGGPDPGFAKRGF